MILHNGIFYTMDSPGDYLIGLTVEESRITGEYRRGDEKRLARDLRRSGRSAMDCRGAFCLPGFVDTHTHAFEGGFYCNCISLKKASTIDELLYLLKGGRPIDGKIIAWEFQQHGLVENRWPSLEELDAVLPDIPCMIRRVDGHSCMINSAAAAGIPWLGKAPDISLPLSGPDNHAASGWFTRSISSREILNAYHTAARIASDYGIVRVHTMIGDGNESLRHYRLVQEHLDDFSIEFVLYPQVTSVPAVLSTGSPRMGGCLLADGSIGSHTAALFDGYADLPGHTGILYRSDDEWTQIIEPAMNEGLDVCVHAIGDRAVDQIARQYAGIKEKFPGADFRNQVIHCEMTPDSVVEKLVAAGACCVMQPLFEAYWGGPSGLYEQRLGPERAAQCDRFRTLTDAGLLVTGGSDWYITEMDVLAGIRGAVNHHLPGEGLTPWEAAALYTRNAAQLIRRGEHQGKLLPGYDAEIVFLEKDPMEPSNLDTNRVSGTYLRGSYRKIS